MFKCLQVSQAHGGPEDQGGVQAQRQHPQRQEETGLHKRADREGKGSLLQRIDIFLNDRNLLLTVYDNSVQGRFLTWENTMQLDTGWQNRLFTLSPGLDKLLLNAIHDVASTPNNLKLLNYSSSTAHYVEGNSVI